MVPVPAIARRPCVPPDDASDVSVPRQSSLDERLRRIAVEEYDFVWRSLRRLGVLPPETDDAAQQVFVVLTDKLSSVEVGKERSYLFSIVMRVAANVRRHRAKRREVPEEEVTIAPSVPAAAEAHLNQAQARAMLDEVLASMSDERRVVFVLFELEEMSLAEIAERLQVPLWTVGSRLRRAREDLRSAIARLKARMQGV